MIRAPGRRPSGLGGHLAALLRQRGEASNTTTTTTTTTTTATTTTTTTTIYNYTNDNKQF